MSKRSQLPVALTIAGSDSGGGAGIQADLKTFAALGVHGTSAITCLTAQNPKGVYGIQECCADIVRRQIKAVFDELRPAAVKTGMLHSAAIIRAVAGALRRHRDVPLVVDPVMVSTSGAQLLEPPAVKALCAQLLPLATVLTPNLDEAGILVHAHLSDVTDLRAAARVLFGRFGCAVLVKGGHLRALREAVDIFFDGRQELLLSAPFVRGVSTHGTGCTYSAAIAGYLARGCALPKAIAKAKEYITQAIARSQTAAGHSVLNWSHLRPANTI
jgi:hydroxymethylpyrimidine/phosphomethylpyrimidine kinase